VVGIQGNARQWILTSQPASQPTNQQQAIDVLLCRSQAPGNAYCPSSSKPKEDRFLLYPSPLHFDYWLESNYY